MSNLTFYPDWEQPPAGQLEQVPAWGGASGSLGYVYRPAVPEQLAEVFALARRNGLTVGLRGGGNSYGDAAMNSENIVVDLRRMNRILAWNPAGGLITVQPGVTLQQLWQYVLEDGWWPPVCTGTMFITIGGGAAMNVHGKNAWKVGPIGDNILAFDLMLPSGEIITCSREQNSDIFHAAIGGFGMLGCFVSLTLKMKRIYSGFLNVEAIASPNLGEMMAYFEGHLHNSDYLVGWVDGTAGRKATGRGQIHRANYLTPESDPYPNQSLRLERQHLPDTLFGLIPKSAMWRFMRLGFSKLGLQFVNRGKYWSSVMGDGASYRQTHVAFHFLLDYVPNFKKAYGPGGLIQYQVFLPAGNAQAALLEILRLSQKRGLPNYLSVLKRHRPDPFLLTHGLDGYSLAMDFPISDRTRPGMVALCREMDAIVLGAGGRFYFAKDSTLRPEVATTYLGAKAIAQFCALKQRCDPQNTLQSNLWRRLFANP